MLAVTSHLALFYCDVVQLVRSSRTSSPWAVNHTALFHQIGSQTQKTNKQ